MIETLLAEIAEAGWLVDLVHQTNDGTWQGSLREVNSNEATYPVSAATAFEALQQAWFKTFSPEDRMVRARVAYSLPSYGVDILADLGLTHKVRRRV